jgi:hypothetical protein
LGSFADVSKFTPADCKDPKKMEQLVSAMSRDSMAVDVAAKKVGIIQQVFGFFSISVFNEEPAKLNLNVAL